MTIFLSVLFFISVSFILSGAYFSYTIEDSIRMREEEGDNYDKEEIQEFLDVSHISCSLFCIGKISGYGLVLGGIGMMVYRVII